MLEKEVERMTDALMINATEEGSSAYSLCVASDDVIVNATVASAFESEGWDVIFKEADGMRFLFVSKDFKCN